jgi:threonine/homoserine/homoserine lactone efflux protein
MPSLEVLLAFAVTTAIFAFIPGPAMLYAAAQTLGGGRWSGFMATLGLHLGGYVHVIAAAAGLSLIFHAVPILYTAVKFAGAAYLIWLGISLFRARDGGDIDPSTVAPRSARRAFFQSVTVEVLNPKTAVFYLAFLPQFIEPAGSVPIWLQFMLFGTFVNLMFSLADIVCVLLASAVMTRLRQSGRAQRLMRKAGGAILVGLGAHLALQRS